MKKVIILLFVAVFSACSEKPSGLLKPEQMQPIILDLVKVDESVNDEKIKDSTLDAKTKRLTLYQQVFNLHKTERDAFFTSYKYYEAHPDQLKLIMDSIQAQILRKRTEDTQKNRPIKIQ